MKDLQKLLKNLKPDKMLLKIEEKEAKEKIANKIKDKEQASLAISEIELNLRKKEAAISEEEKATIDKNRTAF